MTVLGRREPPPGGLRRLNLTRVDLRGARLDEANLQRAWLGGANLQGAGLDDAKLQGATINKGTRWPGGWTQKTAEDRGVQWVD
jgi:uncharacterized protein YjbI with pentapeptide repeats